MEWRSRIELDIQFVSGAQAAYRLGWEPPRYPKGKNLSMQARDADKPYYLVGVHRPYFYLFRNLFMTKNGCHNRQPLRQYLMVQDGWQHDRANSHSRAPMMVHIEDNMSKDCQYQLRHKSDPKCAGCCWLTKEGE